MEAIYWVLSFACHRRCAHCYDDRFRPYVRNALTEVVDEGRAAFRAIINNLPDDMSFLDPKVPQPDGSPSRQRTRLVLAGGELLLDPVREALFYPALEAIRERWGDRGPHISVQTTGDILTPDHIEGMISRGVRTIAIASIDDFHVGLEGEKKFDLLDRVRAMMAPFGAREIGPGSSREPRTKAPSNQPEVGDKGPFFLFFGAQPDLWIGELWPRGRAWKNGLSNADYETNFCARWSGGKNFLNYGHPGSEVAIEPDGSVYPCCLKTKAPLGSLAEEKLTDILDSLRGHPAFEALNAGDPEAMGLASGWSREAFRDASHVIDPKGRAFGNPCLGCDAYFEAILGEDIKKIREKRLGLRAS
jgi:hypothetical protein